MSSDRPLRILYVVPYVPSPIRVRPYQLIRHLAAMGHEITLAALDDDLADPAARAELARVCAAVHIVPLMRRKSSARAFLSLGTPTPLWAAWCQSPEMETLLKSLAGSGGFDVAHVEHLRAAHFASALTPLPAILDAVDCITALRRQMVDQRDGDPSNRILSYIEWSKLKRYEPRVYKNFRRLAVTSDHDAQCLLALDPLLPQIEVIANGVDLDYFAAGDRAPESDHIVFSGKMSYSANDDAARYLVTRILPEIRSLRPRVRLTVVGSSPSPALIREAARVGGVTVTGYVDDLRPYLWQASVGVCPMRIGVGIQNKVLEAMAASRPVVSSSLAARSVASVANQVTSSTDLIADAAVHVANDPGEFALRCVELLADPLTADRAGAAARRYVENYHHWSIAAKAFTMLYHKVLSDSIGNR